VAPQWVRTKVLITVRTYPTPARKGIEVSCTAGVTDDRHWIRLFPVPYRFLSPDKRFRKYQWIELNVTKASDHRPESFHPDIDSIRIMSEPLSTKSNWQARKDMVLPLKSHCLCCLKAERDKTGVPTLGLFKPSAITSFDIEKDRDDWSPEQLARLRQLPMFDAVLSRELEKIPYTFSYRFRCEDPDCPGHKLSCTDWEMGQSYRNWATRYGSDWERYFRQKYETEMILENDTHFYVGTVSSHPDTWIIVGLFYPRL